MVIPLAADESGAERAGRVHGSTGERPAEQDVEGNSQADSQPANFRRTNVDSRVAVSLPNGAVTTVSNNGMMVFNSTVRLNIAVSWKGTDNVTRKKETVTLFTVEGDK